MWMLLAGWLLSAAASPEDGVGSPDSDSPSAKPDPCRVAPPSPSTPFAEELERARALYRRGCHSFALDLLRALDARRRIEPVPRPLLVKTLLYLGEVELVLGRRDEARAVFEALLLLVPDASMNLLEHDPDAIDLFELVKARRPPPPPPVRQEPAPITNRDLPKRRAITYAPYGIGHFAEGDRARAYTYGGAQLAFGATAMAAHFVFNQRWPSGGPPDGRRDLIQAHIVRGVNYGALIGLAATFVISQVDTTRRWRAAQRRELEEQRRRESAARDLSPQLILAELPPRAP